MKSRTELEPAVQLALLALVLLGMVGGSMVVAHSGFATSGKHGGASVFVPAPQAYVMAAAMYGMSVIGLIALLRAQKPSKVFEGIGVTLYVCAAAALTVGLRAL